MRTAVTGSPRLLQIPTDSRRSSTFLRGSSKRPVKPIRKGTTRASSGRNSVPSIGMGMTASTTGRPAIASSPRRV